MADRAKQFRVVNGFGHWSRKPFVQVTVGETFIQVTPTKARQLAGMLMEAAEAADGDGLIRGFLAEFIKLDEQQAAGLLMQFREYRNARRAEEEAELEAVEPFDPDQGPIDKWVGSDE